MLFTYLRNNCIIFPNTLIAVERKKGSVISMLDALYDEIRNFVVNWSELTLPDKAHYYDEPLLGIADGDDPLFAELQQVIGPFHWTPREVLANSGHIDSTGPISVISWSLPISSVVRKSNRPETLYPSREWSYTRSHGEALNGALRRHIVSWFNGQGIPAVAPQFAPGWLEQDDPIVGIASSWSERHAAYAAGLGTFSLNDGLITERGIAHRLGSVVAATALPPTPRSKGLHDNCLYHSKGTCGACIRRCPVDALSKAGHDKNRCREHVYGTVPRAVGQLYNVPATGCGLCQTAVPCEQTNPCRATAKD